jgi:hypothetical protein
MSPSLHLTTQHGPGLLTLINKEIVADYIPAMRVRIAMHFMKKASLYLLTK